MQKVEKWRLQELALILRRLTGLLKQGDNREWSSVFEHYRQEVHGILLTRNYDRDTLNRLVQNIQNCFSGMSSFKNLVLHHDNSTQMSKLNQEFYEEKVQLIEALLDFEKRLQIYIN
jgi:hypothetical protein